MLQGKKIVVTGGSGFIGSHLVKRLVTEGAQVHVFLRATSTLARIQTVIDAITMHHVDLVDREAVHILIKSIQPDGIFHLAATNQSYSFVPTPSDLVAGNVLATVNLLDALQELPYDFFVQAGSFGEVGTKNEPIREDHICEPTEFYSISKLSATLYGQAVGKIKTKPVVTIRVFTPYGPFMQSGKIVTQLIEGALTGKEVTLSAPSVTRDFIYIDDLIDLFILVSGRAKDFPGEIFNGGTGVATELGVLVSEVEGCTNGRIPAIWSDNLASYDHTIWQADMSKVATKLQWSPRIRLDEGVRKSVKWFKNNQDYWRQNRNS